MKPSDYTFVVTPDPIARTRRITRLEKHVWSVVYSWDLMGRTGLSVRKIAELAANGDRKRARAALAKLVSLDLLTEARRRHRGVHLVDYTPAWPTWIEAEGAAYLRPGAGKKSHMRDASSRNEEDKKVPKLKVKKARNPRGEMPPPLGRGAPTTLGQLAPTTLGQLAPPYKSLEKKKTTSADARVGADENVYKSTRTPDERKVTSEEEEINYDSGSAEALRVLTLPRKKKPTGSARSARRAPSGEEFLERPSERWEFRRGERKARTAWTGLDLVGYWVRRHADLRGVEDEDFFVANVGVKFVLRTARNATTFVRRYLGGDFSRAAAAVDAILERAEERGRPVAFAYYFTPKSGEALEKILRVSERGARGRPKTPVERSDTSGSDLAYWRARAAAQVEDRAGGAS